MPAPLPIRHALHDGHLLLRPLRAADVPALVDAVRGSLSTLARWLPWCHAGYATADADAWVAHVAGAWHAGSAHAFGIFDVHLGTLMGGAGLSRVDHTAATANLGYWVAGAHCGGGVATRAARMVADFGFATLGLARLEIVALPDNRASLRVAEKLGAMRVGMVVDRVCVGGRPAPAVLCALDADAR